MHIHVYQITKNRGADPCNSLRHTEIRHTFRVSLQNKVEGKCTWSTWRGKWEKRGNVLADKNVTLS